jgi:hypothetical protein
VETSLIRERINAQVLKYSLSYNAIQFISSWLYSRLYLKT